MSCKNLVEDAPAQCRGVVTFKNHFQPKADFEKLFIITAQSASKGKSGWEEQVKKKVILCLCAPVIAPAITGRAIKVAN